MTSEEKIIIQELRAKGTGYKKIAAMVGISESTVKSFLKRNSAAEASSEARVTKAAKKETEPKRNPRTAPWTESEPPVERVPATVTEATAVSQPVTEAEPATEANQVTEALPTIQVTEALPTIEEAVTPVKKKETPVEEAKSLADEHTPFLPQPVSTPPQESCTVRPCLFCGTPVPQIPGRKEKKFCTASCRTQWWNRNKYKIPRKTVHTYRCPTCGKEFYAYGTTKRKYCSQACYFKGRFYNSTSATN